MDLSIYCSVTRKPFAGTDEKHNEDLLWSNQYCQAQCISTKSSAIKREKRAFSDFPKNTTTDQIAGMYTRLWQQRKAVQLLRLGCQFCINQQPPQRGGAVPEPVWGGRNSCWPSRNLQLPREFPSIQSLFSPCCTLNDRRRAALSLFEIGRPSCLFLSSLSLARMLIFLLLVISSDVHPNPGPVFPLSALKM